MSLPVITFIIKLLARIIFTVIRGKYGLEPMRNTRRLEKLSLCVAKIDCDLKFLLECKRNNTIPKFARPKLSIYASYKVKQKIAKTIIEAELSNKHKQKKKSTLNIQKDCYKLTLFN